MSIHFFTQYAAAKQACNHGDEGVFLSERYSVCLFFTFSRKL